MPDFHIVGSKDPPFALFGRMTGVSNLTIGESRRLIIGENASTGFIKNGSYLQEPVDGELSFGMLTMEAGTKFLKPGDLKLVLGTLHMKKETLIPARTLEMTIIDAHLEGGSRIITSGQGPKAGQGHGRGRSGGNVGSGAGHGGPGGPSSSTAGGSTYGSYVYPLFPGSGGGNGAGAVGGGAGGSTIQVRTPRKLANSSFMLCALFDDTIKPETENPS